MQKKGRTENINELKHNILGMLSEKRLVHTQGVRRTAARMCEKYGADPDKTDLAVCFHDLYRGRCTDELDEMVDKLGLAERYKGNANLSHGKIAAVIMEKEYGITEKEILDAVSFHTTGRAGMGLIEKIVFLADAIEPGRDYPGVDEIRKTASEDLDRACLLSLEGTVKFLEDQGYSDEDIDKDTIQARDWLKNEYK